VFRDRPPLGLPHLKHDTFSNFGGDSNVNQYSRTGS